MPASPVAYPLGPPTVSGTLITIDELLAQPTRITRDIADIAQQRMFTDRIFTPAGNIQGGAVLFEQPNAVLSDLYAERDVQEVAPGAVFPLMTFLRGQPMVARPRKIGGKWYVTREARLRNDTALLARYIRQTGNTIIHKTDQMALAELDAVATAQTRFRTGQSWSTAAAVTQLNRSGINLPLADIIAAQNAVDLEERGVVLNGIVLHPNDNASLVQVYGADNVDSVLASAGITERFVSPRQTAGRARLYAAGMVGEWRNEFPLTEEVEAEGVADGGRQRTWYQWSISPSMYVTDPYAYMEIRGIA